MATIKISIIGAGSGAFTMSLINDICLTPNLHASTISLMDIDPERLADAHALCCRFVQKTGAPITLQTTLDRRESLRGADFVVVIALVDGARRLKQGWLVAEKHGAKWGGSYHILYDEPFWLNFYQLRLFEAIAQDMLELCPHAWMLLVSNPVLAATTLLQRDYPALNMVGLCHGYNGVYEIADVLRLGREHLTYEIPGVNHFVWLTSLYHEGQDVFPIIDRWLETEAQQHWKTHPEGTMGIKKMDLYRKLRAIPIGDTASITGASWPWWYHSDGAVEQRWRTDSRDWWYRYVADLAAAPQRLSHLARRPAAAPEHNGSLHLSGDSMIPIIESISCDIPRVIITNIQNTSHFVAGIPSDFEVEIPTLVSKRGVQGVKTKGLPKALIAHTLRDRVAPVEIELEAYRTGSRDLLTHLVLMDKWINSQDQANGLIDEVFSLPYHQELRQHYR